MKPSVKFGFVGGIVYLLILIIGTYYMEQTVRNMTVVVYLKFLVYLVSVLAAVKGIRDLDKNVPLELREGMKAGLTTVLIICMFVYAFGVIYPNTITEADFTATNEIGFHEHFKRSPIADTTQKGFDSEMKKYETAIKANDIFQSSLSLHTAKEIRPNDHSLDEKMKAVDHQLFIKYHEIGFLLKSVFLSDVFPLLVMGLAISFISTMLFRSRQ
jgi:hypothetical protein